MIYTNSCPRCRGTLSTSKYSTTEYISCINCGYYREVDLPPPPDPPIPWRELPNKERIEFSMMRCNTVTYLRYEMGMRIAEIAEVLDVATRTVFRGLRRRREIADEPVAPFKLAGG